MMLTHKCDQCGQSKLETEFYPSQLTSSRKAKWCKSCLKEYKSKKYSADMDRLRMLGITHTKRNVLGDEEVQFIRESKANKMDLAIRFRVMPSVIKAIQDRLNYKNIPELEVLPNTN